MNNLVCIGNITLSKKNILYVKPQNACFEKIYRSAMGVHWDNDSKSLYFASPIEQESDILKAYCYIASAVKEEYGNILKVQLDTIYENINDNIKIVLSTEVPTI